MEKIQSDKKLSENSQKYSLSDDCINHRMIQFNDVFVVYRRDNSQTAKNYITGLITCEKGHANMERMVEEVEGSNYPAYHHFISHSKWDHEELISRIAIDASQIMEANKKATQLPTGYIIDESAHLKKGKASIGVANQYAGVAGKVDNCQVAVYSSLVNDTRATIINESIFLPKSWINDKKRCDKAKIPESARTYKTKPELALDMIDRNVADGVKFDWIGGDGLYGHNFELTKGLDQRGLLYVLDVHKDEKIYLEEPQIIIPVATKARGRRPTKLQALGVPSLRLDQYIKTLNQADWTEEKVRKTAKGWLKLQVHTKQVWVWNGKEEQARRRIVVITRTVEKRPKVKYSFSNAQKDQYTNKEFAYFQVQRYWVERTFDDSKNELGMSDYQIRNWIGWHHHQSLVMLAGIFLLKEKIEKQTEYPLMSTRDARILLIFELFGTKEQYQKRINQMKIRHMQRQSDIDRYYRYEELWE